MILVLLLLLQGPAADLQNAEPQVAAKIQKLMRDARNDPKSDQAWGKLGMTLHIHDYLNEAIAAYDRAIECQREFRWLYLRAVAIHQAGSENALPALRLAIQMKTDYVPAQLRIAQILLDESRWNDARDVLEAVLRIDARSAHAYLGLAEIAMAEGNLTDAKGFVQKAIQRNNQFAEAHGLLAEIFRRSNDPVKMIEELKVAQRLPKDTGPRDPILLDLVREGVSAYWYETRGRALLEQKHYRAAEAELQAAIKARPEARVYDLLGIAYRAQNKHREAIAQHRKAIELKRDSAESWHNLASAHAAASQRDEAIECWQKARALAKDNPQLLQEIDANVTRYKADD